LENITLADYNKDKEFNDNALKTSIAQSAQVNDPNAVTGLVLTQASLALLSFRRTATPKLSASYKISFYLGEGNSLTKPEDSPAALTASVNNGDFTKTMQAITASSSSALKTSSSPAVTTDNLVTYDVGGDSGGDDKTLSDGEIAAAIVVPIVVILLVAVSDLSTTHWISYYVNYAAF
jgi:hypothetical protein